MQGLGMNRQAVAWAQGMLKAAGASILPKHCHNLREWEKEKKKKMGRKELVERVTSFLTPGISKTASRRA